MWKVLPTSPISLNQSSGWSRLGSSIFLFLISATLGPLWQPSCLSSSRSSSVIPPSALLSSSSSSSFSLSLKVRLSMPLLSSSLVPSSSLGNSRSLDFARLPLSSSSLSISESISLSPIFFCWLPLVMMLSASLSVCSKGVMFNISFSKVLCNSISFSVPWTWCLFSF